MMALRLRPFSQSLQPGYTMLRGLRKATNSWLGKTIMGAVVGFLILAFAIWGIGDVFRSGGRATVATVGNTEISAEQFRQAYSDQLQQLQRQLGRPIPPEQARAFGLDRQLLEKMMAEAALNERVRKLGLGIGDTELARRITQDPAFRGINGQFDQQRFEQTIRAVGYTEPRYIAKLRNDMLRKQLEDTLIAGVTVPRAAIEAFNRYQSEERSIDYVVLGLDAVGEIPSPSPEVLAKYFDDRKSLFRAPEYRKLIVLAVTPDELARSIEISDADAKRAYEERLARYTISERREVQQIVFPNEEEAGKAAQQLKDGATFDALVAERRLKDTDVNLGLVPKTGIVDPAVADAAFALPPGGVSDLVKGRFGVTLVRVTKVELGSVKPFAEVESELKRELALDRAKAQVAEIRNKIEDELASGARLDEVAKKLQLPFRSIDAVDRSGRDPAGNPVADLPANAELLPSAFSAAVAAENDPLQVQGGGFVWYEVAAITPGRDRSLDDVKEKVEARWRENEIETRLRAKADEMVKKIDGGAKLADLAATDKLNVLWANNLKRRGSDALPSQVIAAVFRTPQGSAGTAEGKDPTERVVFRVINVNVPTFDAASPDVKRLEDALRRVFGEELLTEYLIKLEAEIGTRVNQSAINQALGSSGNQ
jgi:peptidyl-prolyl cis-trans isomerase D